MNAPTRNSRIAKEGVGAAILLSASVGAALAMARTEHGIATMSAQQTSTMVRAIAAAKAVRFAHTVVERRPAAFATVKPCRYSRPLAPLTADLDRLWVQRCAAAFDLDRRPPGSRGATGFACRSDTSRHDDLQLRFDTGRDTVIATLNLDSGTATILWNDAQTPPMILGPRAADLRALMIEALPADSMLRTIRVCTATSPDSSIAASADAPGSYVYVEQLPEIASRKAPIYPEDARRDGVEGTVMVQALVGTDGLVRETMITRSVPVLDAAAVRAVERWTFNPARSNGKPTAVWVAVPVRFKLN